MLSHLVLIVNGRGVHSGYQINFKPSVSGSGQIRFGFKVGDFDIEI